MQPLDYYVIHNKDYIADYGPPAHTPNQGAAAVNARFAELEAMINPMVTPNLTSTLGADAVIGATSITLAASPYASMSGLAWMLIDPFTTECELRPVTFSGTGNMTVSFDRASSANRALRFNHTTGDLVLFLESPDIHVAFFGAAAGTSSIATQNTLGIQRTCEAASHMADVKGQNTSIVRFGPGNYFIEAEIKINRGITLIGFGPKQTSICAAPTFVFASSEVVMLHQYRDTLPVNVTGANPTDRLYMRNIRLDGMNVYTPGAETTVLSTSPGLYDPSAAVTIEAPQGSAFITVSTVTPFLVGYQVTFPLDNGVMHVSNVKSIVGSQLELSTLIPSGRTVLVDAPISHVFNNYFTTVQSVTGDAILNVATSATYSLNARIAVQYSDDLWHFSNVAAVGPGTITLATPIPAGKTVWIGAGVHKVQTVQVADASIFGPVGTVLAEYPKMQIHTRLPGTEFNTVAEVIDATHIGLGRRSLGGDIDAGSLITIVTQGANGLVCSLQQPSYSENVIIDNMRGFGVGFVGCVQGVFQNYEVVNCHNGVWMQGASLLYFHSFNIEDCTGSFLKMDYLSGTVPCKWNHFIGCHIEGLQGVGVAAFDVSAGFQNYWFNTWIGDCNGWSYVWRFRDHSTTYQASTYQIFGGAINDGSTSNALAVRDFDRGLRFRTLEDFDGVVDHLIGQSHNQSRQTWAIRIPGMNGRALRLGAPFRQATEPALIEFLASSLGNNLQPHFRGRDKDGLTSSRLDPDGVIQVRSVRGLGNAPTVTMGVAAGTNPGTPSPTPPVPTVIGTDLAGKITFTTGSNAPVVGTLFTMVFAQPFAIPPTPSELAVGVNGATAKGAGTRFYVVSVSTTQVVWGVQGTALASSTSYTLYYHHLQ